MPVGGRKFHRVWLIATFFVFWPYAANPAEQPDAEIIEQMIDESVMTYRGACPCPDRTEKGSASDCFSRAKEKNK